VTWLWLKGVRAVINAQVDIQLQPKLNEVFSQSCLISVKGAGWLLSPLREFVTAPAAKVEFPKVRVVNQG